VVEDYYAAILIHVAGMALNPGQIDGSTSRSFGGAGPGPSISRSLAQLLNGEFGTLWPSLSRRLLYCATTVVPPPITDTSASLRNVTR
jgi:hypothetical protein